MGKCIQQKANHQDTNLESLPAKGILLSSAKRFLIRLFDKNGDKMFALSDSEVRVSHSQSVDPDQSRAATLSEKLEGAIKNNNRVHP